MKILKKFIKKGLRKIGIDRINRGLKSQGVKYELAKSGATYYNYYWRKATKRIDLKTLPIFWETASMVIDDQRTSLYYDRLYTLWQGVLSIPSFEYPIAEVGTYRGGSAKFIIETMKKNGKRNKFFVFDTFEGHVLVDQELDDRQQIGDFGNVSYEDVNAYLSSPDVAIHKGNFLETARHIDHITNFGMVHIDVDVHPVTTFCLEFFENRTLPGSMIIIDDYGNHSCKGLKKAVDDFVENNSNFKMFYLLTGQALLIKVNDKYTSGLKR